MIFRSKKYNVFNKGINFVGPVNAMNGLGVSARGYISALSKTNLPLNVLPWHTGFERVKKMDFQYPNCSEQSLNIVHLNFDIMSGLKLLNVRPLSRLIDRSHYNICIPYWELQSIPFEWFKTINQFDEIWCASKFMASSLEAITSRPVKNVYPALDWDIEPSNKTRSNFRLPENKFLFFYAADAGSGFGRKNLFGYIDAYIREFKPNEGSCCVCKIGYVAQKSAELIKILGLIKNRKDIVLIQEFLTEEDMAALFKQIDCYVSPHRSEGLGLTILEAMAAAKPVIATPYGGPRDFINAETAFPIEYALTEVKLGNEPYPSGYIWAEPSLDSIRKQMRLVFSSQEEAKRRGQLGKLLVEQMFSYKQTSKIMNVELTRIFQTFLNKISD